MNFRSFSTSESLYAVSQLLVVELSSCRWWWCSRFCQTFFVYWVFFKCVDFFLVNSTSVFSFQRELFKIPSDTCTILFPALTFFLFDGNSGRTAAA